MPLEIIMSKYYGESERLLGSVFSLANDLPDGGIIFLDEVCFIFIVYRYQGHFNCCKNVQEIYCLAYWNCQDIPLFFSAERSY